MATAPQQYELLELMVKAVEDVKIRLRRSAEALEAAGIPYAVIGGNAVAAWVETVEPSAVRTTVDVDLLLRREDFVRARTALETAGFIYDNILGVDLFLDNAQANPRQAVHILWANEKVKESYAVASPDVEQCGIIQGRRVLDLESLVRMKLIANRDKDRTHLRDFIEVGLIDQNWVYRFPTELAARLQHLFDTPGG
jgi:hypothetical protein